MADILQKMDKYITSFKKMSIAKQSLIATTAIGAIIALIGNYKNIKDMVVKLINKYQNSESVKEFTKDVISLVQPVIDKVKGFFE